jgi:hypothetical protein
LSDGDSGFDFDDLGGKLCGNSDDIVDDSPSDDSDGDSGDSDRTLGTKPKRLWELGADGIESWKSA